MTIIGVLFFFFVALSAFFVLTFLITFIPYWLYLGVKEMMSSSDEAENEAVEA